MDARLTRMPIDPSLLRLAEEARDRADDLEQETARARAAYHEAVCDLHRAGATLRELADALQLSHQRVHQIVGARAAGGGPWARLRRARSAVRSRTPLSCSFCGAAQAERRKLIAGPGISICDACVAIAQAVLDTGEAGATALVPLEPTTQARCRFCGLGGRRTGGPLVAGGGLSICGRCLGLCREVLSSTAPDSQPRT